jgi:hypothetical protein
MARRKDVPRRPTTCVAFLHAPDVAASFAYSLVRLMMYETARTRVPPYLIAQRCPSGQLVDMRNRVVRHFLETEAEWLLFVDADMGFPADALERLLAAADPHIRPLVGGLCFGQWADNEHFDDATQAVHTRAFPTIYQWNERRDDQDDLVEVGFSVAQTYPGDELVECSATGAAFFIAHRSALEKIRDDAGERWFHPVTHPVPPPHGTVFSEDLSFFIRAAASGLPCFVHTGVRTSHAKTVWYTEASFSAQEAGRSFVSPDGTPKVDPGLLAEALRSLR